MVFGAPLVEIAVLLAVAFIGLLAGGSTGHDSVIYRLDSKSDWGAGIGAQIVVLTALTLGLQRGMLTTGWVLVAVAISLVTAVGVALQVTVQLRNFFFYSILHGIEKGAVLYDRDDNRISAQQISEVEAEPGLRSSIRLRNHFRQYAKDFPEIQVEYVGFSGKTYSRVITAMWLLGVAPLIIALIASPAMARPNSMPGVFFLLAVVANLAALGAIVVFAWGNQAGPATPRHVTTRLSKVRHHSNSGSAKLSDALRPVADANQPQQLVARLERSLPAWPVRATVTEVITELLALRRNVTTARATGVPEVITSQLDRQAQDTLAILLNRIDRLAAVASMVSPAGPEAHPSLADYRSLPASTRGLLEREQTNLGTLLHEIGSAKQSLVELTLTGGRGEAELAQVERRFRAVSETAREIQESDLA